jgi:hypothetical protein
MYSALFAAEKIRILAKAYLSNGAAKHSLTFVHETAIKITTKA